MLEQVAHSNLHSRIHRSKRRGKLGLTLASVELRMAA